MSWPLVKLETLGIIYAGGTPSRRKPNYWGAGHKWLSIKDYKDFDLVTNTAEQITNEGLENSSAKLFKKDSVIISIFATLGRVAILGEEMATNQAIAAIRCNEKVNNKYLMYCLKSKLADILKQSGGVAQKNINLSILKGLTIPLPPLETQKQIAAVLDKADQLRKDCQQMELELNSLAQSVFIDMFGDPVSNPKGWSELPFSTVVKNIHNGQSPKCNTHPAKKNEWGVLKLSAVTGGTYKPHENKAIFESSVPNTSIEVEKGDLLFTRKNTYELVGSCAYVTDTPNKLMLPDLIFRFDMPNHLKIYVWGLFNSNEFKQTIKNLASGAAGSMPNISKARLNNLLLPIPSTEAISKYTNLIMAIWQQIDLLHQTQHQYEESFNALMQKAFKGELNLDKPAA